MKIVTSYFYQIRNFTRNMVPISTACWDPLWFHEGTKDYNRIFKDKRGIYNGIRGEIFHFDNSKYTDEMMCGDACVRKDPTQCAFLREYRRQIYELDFDMVMSELTRIANNVQQLEGFEEEPIIALIVYETPKNPCSERGVLQQWFTDNGCPVSEWEAQKTNRKE